VEGRRCTQIEVVVGCGRWECVEKARWNLNERERRRMRESEKSKDEMN